MVGGYMLWINMKRVYETVMGHSVLKNLFCFSMSDNNQMRKHYFLTVINYVNIEAPSFNVYQKKF